MSHAYSKKKFVFLSLNKDIEINGRNGEGFYEGKIGAGFSDSEEKDRMKLKVFERRDKVIYPRVR